MDGEGRCRKEVKNTVRSIKGRKNRLRGREGAARGKEVNIRALNGSDHKSKSQQIKDSNLLACDAVIQQTVPYILKDCSAFRVKLKSYTMILLTVKNNSPNTSSHPRRPEPSATLP